MSSSVRDRILRRRQAIRKATAYRVAGYAVSAACAVTALLAAAVWTWPMLERAALGREVSRGSGDPNKLWRIDEHPRITKKLLTALPPPPKDLTMFRGNPARLLSAIGTVPRRPKLLWRFQTHTKLEGPYEQRGSKKLTDTTPWSGLGWTGQPLLYEGRYYFGSADSYVYCLDAATGQCAWYYPNHHCIKGSIAMFGGYIYHGGRDNKIHCYNLDGQMVWETRTGNDMDSSPVVVDGLGYIGGEDHYIYCFDPRTGKIVWKSQRTLGSFEDSPCIAGNTVVLGNSRGELLCLARKTGKPLWKFNTRGDTDSTPVYDEGRIFVGCATGDEDEVGYYYCLDAKTGAPIWQLSFPRGFWATAALNPAAGRLYIGNNNGVFYALRMSDGGLVWKRNLYTRIWGSAAVTDGCAVVGTRDGRVWCLEENTGKPLWVFDALGDIDATPCIAGGRILTGDQTGWVYCIGEAPPSEPINPHWFVTKFPQGSRLDHNARGIPLSRNPAPPPGTYQDTNADCRDHYLKPVYGPGYKGNR